MPSTSSATRHRLGLSRTSFGIALLVASGLGACASRHDVTGSFPSDYRDRHPIALVQANETLDVFVGAVGGRLDARQQEDVRQFAREYMEKGQGPLIAYLPSGGHAHGVNAGLNSIRQTLAGGGASGRLQIAHYQPNTGNVSPIRLVFAKLKAETPSHCGYGGEDIVPVKFSENIQNNVHRNFGCTYQKNLAAQVADPRDFVRPRQEGPIDVEKRLAGIERARETDTHPLQYPGNTLPQSLGK